MARMERGKRQTFSQATRQRLGPRQFGGERCKDSGQFGPEQNQRRDDHDGHQTGDQTVLDGGGAGLILNEFGDEVFHGKNPFWGGGHDPGGTW